MIDQFRAVLFILLTTMLLSGLLVTGNYVSHAFALGDSKCDIALTALNPVKTVIGLGYPLDVTVTLINLGNVVTTFTLGMNITFVQPPTNGITLYADAADGWNSTIPGPVIGAVQGDPLILTLISNDSKPHQFWIDLNDDHIVDPAEPMSPVFQNMMIVTQLPPLSGGLFNFMYYDALNPDTMYGQYVLLDPFYSRQIASQNITLQAGQEMNTTLVWNTTSDAIGRYMLNGYAFPVDNETITDNNILTYGNVALTVPGDVNGELLVDMGDVVRILMSFGSTGDMTLRYAPNSDIDGNEQIDMQDVIIALINFGD